MLLPDLNLAFTRARLLVRHFELQLHENFSHFNLSLVPKLFFTGNDSTAGAFQIINSTDCVTYEPTSTNLIVDVCVCSSPLQTFSLQNSTIFSPAQGLCWDSQCELPPPLPQRSHCTEHLFRVLRTKRLRQHEWVCSWVVHVRARPRVREPSPGRYQQLFRPRQGLIGPAQ